MKCSKCGQECKENQKICIKCGSPLPVVNGMNRFEKNLADEIEEILDTADKNEEDSDIRILDDLVLIDETREADFVLPESEEEDDEYVIDNEFSLDDVEMALKARERKRKEEAAKKPPVKKVKSEREKREERKKLYIKLGVGAAVVLALVIGLTIFINVNHNKKYHTAFDQGCTFYEAANYQRAEEYLKNALSLAGKKEDRIKEVRRQLYLTYFAMESYTDAEKVLRDMIASDENDVENYKALIDVYRKTNEEDKITSLIDSLKGKTFYEALVDYNVDTPVISTPSGEYGSFVRVDLSCSFANAKILYTLSEGKEPENPVVSGTVYEGQILIREEGEWHLRAVSLTSNGSYSEVASADYTIAFKAPEEPEITPDSGEFSEETEITVKVPEHCKVYYTIEEVLDITELEDATLYTKPFKMERGNLIYRFVVESENGLYSDIYTRFYNYAMERTYDYDQAVSVLMKKLYGQGILLNSDAEYSDNTYVDFSYVETPVIDKNEYYVIAFSMKTDSGETVADKVLYGVNASDGHIVNVEKDSKGYKIIEDIKLTLPEEPTSENNQATSEGEAE